MCETVICLMILGNKIRAGENDALSSITITQRVMYYKQIKVGEQTRKKKNMINNIALFSLWCFFLNEQDDTISFHCSTFNKKNQIIEKRTSEESISFIKMYALCILVL